MRSNGRRGRFRGKLRIQHFHVALPAQVGEPIVEQLVDLLLQQDFLNARRYLRQRRNGFAGRVLRQQSVVIVGFNLLRRDLNALPEALLNEAQNLQPVAEIGLDALRSEPMRREKRLPSRIGGAVLADADGQFRADLMQARIDFLLRGLDGFDVLLADLLLDERAADQLIERLLPGDLDLAGRVLGSRTERRISSSRSLARMTCLLTTATARSRTTGDADEGPGCWAANVGSAESSSARTRNFAAAFRRKATAGPSTPRGGKARHAPLRMTNLWWARSTAIRQEKAIRIGTDLRIRRPAPG